MPQITTKVSKTFKGLKRKYVKSVKRDGKDVKGFITKVSWNNFGGMK